MQTQLYMLVTFLTVMANQASGYLRVCYYTNWSQYRPKGGKYTPDRVDPNLCTHIVFAFAKLEGNKLVPFEWNDDSTEWSTGSYAKINNLRQQNPRLKTLLAVGGWNAGSPPFSDMASASGGRAEFVNTTIGFLRSRGFDGLDMDWEYPAKRGGRAHDKQNLVRLLNELRLAFNREAARTGRERLLLTAAVPAGKSNVAAGYDVPSVARALDFINLMAYDLHGSWESKTGHNSPLFARGGESADERLLNMDWAANYWVQQGAPKQKLVIGLALYGRSFRLASTTHSGMGAAALGPGQAGNYTREAGFLAYYEICEMLHNGATRVWNAEQRVPYLVKDNLWVGYDDEESIKVKIHWLKQGGFGGAMVWSIALDDFSGQFCDNGPYPLLRIINRELGNAVNVDAGSGTTTSTAKPGAVVNGTSVSPIVNPSPFKSRKLPAPKPISVVPTSPSLIAPPPIEISSLSMAPPVDGSQKLSWPVYVPVLPVADQPRHIPESQSQSFNQLPPPSIIPVASTYTNPFVLVNEHAFPSNVPHRDKLPASNMIRVDIPAPPPINVRKGILKTDSTAGIATSNGLEITSIHTSTIDQLQPITTDRSILKTPPVLSDPRLTSLHSNKLEKTSTFLSETPALPQAIPIDFGSDMLPPDFSNLLPAMFKDVSPNITNVPVLVPSLPPFISMAEEIIVPPTIKQKILKPDSKVNPKEIHLSQPSKKQHLSNVAGNSDKTLSHSSNVNIALSPTANRQRNGEKSILITNDFQSMKPKLDRATWTVARHTDSDRTNQRNLEQSLALGPINNYVPNVDFIAHNQLASEVPRIISLFDRTTEGISFPVQPASIIQHNVGIHSAVTSLPKVNPDILIPIKNSDKPNLMGHSDSNIHVANNANTAVINNRTAHNPIADGKRTHSLKQVRIDAKESTKHTVAKNTTKTVKRITKTRTIASPSVHINVKNVNPALDVTNMLNSDSTLSKLRVAMKVPQFRPSSIIPIMAPFPNNRVGVPISNVPRVFRLPQQAMPHRWPRTDDIKATLIGTQSLTPFQAIALRMNLNKDFRLIPLSG